MTARNKSAGILCIMGGVLLVGVGSAGMKPLLEGILKYIRRAVNAYSLMRTIFGALICIAAVG